MEKILTLLDLHKQASFAPDLKSFEFLAVNKTNELVAYKQAVFWTKNDFKIELKRISGNSVLDSNGTYAQWLKNFIKKFGLKHNAEQEIQNNVLIFSRDTIDARQKSEWDEHAAKHCALIIFKTPEGEISSGLWIERDKEFNKADHALLEELSLLYSQTYSFLRLRKKSGFLSWKTIKKHQKFLLLLCVIIAFIPVRLTITAPAEIIADNPTIITVPYDGVLDDIIVKPGDSVEENQPLFKMDMTDLNGEIETAGQALKTAKQNLSRIRRESLSDPEKKSEITQLQAEIAARQVDYDHAQKLISKGEVFAPKSGIIIFSDANDFEGQPVRTGAKIMTIADPNDIELLIKVPVDNMAPITAESDVQFFLNVAPLSGYSANINTIGYQASSDADGLLTYKIRAQINGADDLRIGWKGTAKIKGEWTVLIYSLLRRPLITLRHITGL